MREIDCGHQKVFNFLDFLMLKILTKANVANTMLAGSGTIPQLRAVPVVEA
ncbi:MAG: hypothetical protein MKZ95_00390 [Pirellulales bacterium]|nr:hypothetical protein [Pirellulales bacterium]